MLFFVTVLGPVSTKYEIYGYQTDKERLCSFWISVKQFNYKKIINVLKRHIP